MNTDTTKTPEIEIEFETSATTTTHKFTAETLEKFHKIFGHISEFPEIDPSAGIVINENDYISEMEKHERI